MVATVRAGLAVLLLGVPFALSGCSINALKVVIPDFESNQILGVNVYRQVADTGDPAADWERVSRVVFGSPYVNAEGLELMDYTVKSDDGEFGFATGVKRSAETADRVTVELLFAHGRGAEMVRVTTFNAVGESLPSEEAMQL